MGCIWVFLCLDRSFKNPRQVFGYLTYLCLIPPFLFIDKLTCTHSFINKLTNSSQNLWIPEIFPNYFCFNNWICNNLSPNVLSLNSHVPYSLNRKVNPHSTEINSDLSAVSPNRIVEQNTPLIFNWFPKIGGGWGILCSLGNLRESLTIYLYCCITVYRGY